MTNTHASELNLPGALLSDVETLDAFSFEKQFEHFSAFERALAKAHAEVGLVSTEISKAAIAAIDSFDPDIQLIREYLVTDGVPVPEYVRQLKAFAGRRCEAAIHAGATSQDLIDTATVLTLRESNLRLVCRIQDVLATLESLRVSFGDAVMMGRTRMQAAVPISVSDRIAVWYAPFLTHLDRLEQIRPRIEVLQFGGAVGNRAVLGVAGDEIALEVARVLELNNPPRAWHVMRDGMAEYAGWLSLVTGTLGKMGQDICLMAQQGVEELQLSGGGSSSAMPHKQNPVLAELLVTCARYNAVQLSGMHQALVHEQERSGAAWTLEWMILPAMVSTTGRSLLVAQSLLDQIARLGSVGDDAEEI